MRKIVAVFLGAVIGSLTLFVVGMIANAIQPTPPELMDPDNAEAVVPEGSSHLNSCPDFIHFWPGTGIVFRRSLCRLDRPGADLGQSILSGAFYTFWS